MRRLVPDSVQPAHIHTDEDCRIPGCESCALKKPFQLPEQIVEACQKGELIIFAGAGISTESRGVYSSSFYHNVRTELKVPKHESISFSKLMTQYCSAKSRKELLLAIKNRIDYVRAFPELYETATEFHSELATIPHIHEIFTTNWDDFFERECAATPVVTGEDFAIFQDIPGRKVFKLHGSVYNYGSIIATEDDYNRCYRQLTTGIIGAKLKTHLMSKTLVFAGFSFDDEDFRKIYQLLSNDVKGMIPKSYLVTLDDKAGEKLKKLKFNVEPIITSAVYFFQVLKRQLVKNKDMLPDEIFNGIEGQLATVAIEHKKTSNLPFLQHPHSMYSLLYQDGLAHAYQHILNNRNTGEYSDPARRLRIINSYEHLIKEYRRAGDYPNVAYFTGYLTGQMSLLVPPSDRIKMPLYFLFGCGDIRTIKEFLRLEPRAEEFHKRAHKLAMVLAQRINSNQLMFHRKPFL